MTAEPTFAFDNSYTRLPNRFFVRMAPTPIPAPQLVRLNLQLAQHLGLDPEGSARGGLLIKGWVSFQSAKWVSFQPALTVHHRRPSERPGQWPRWQPHAARTGPDRRPGRRRGRICGRLLRQESPDNLRGANFRPVRQPRRYGPATPAPPCRGERDGSARGAAQYSRSGGRTSSAAPSPRPSSNSESAAPRSTPGSTG